MATRMSTPKAGLAIDPASRPLGWMGMWKTPIVDGGESEEDEEDDEEEEEDSSGFVASTCVFVYGEKY